METFKASVNQLERALDNDSIPWKQVVVTGLWASWAFETYISLRQYPLYSRKSPPPTLERHVDAETFKKSQAYGKDKAQYALVKSLVSQLITWAIVQFDVYVRVWTVAGAVLDRFGFGGYEILQSLVYAAMQYLVLELCMLPLSLYYTFVLEEKHGFNKTTLQTWILDLFKGWLVGFVLGGPFIAALLWIIRWAGDNFVAYVVGFFLAFQLLATILIPTVIQPLFNKFTPLPEGALRERVYKLAGSIKFPLKHLYMIDGSRRSAHSNAYFFGVLPWSKHIVIYDTLIEKQSVPEIEAVLAHELGHWAHADPVKLIALSQVQIFFTMSVFTLFIHNGSLYRAFGFGDKGTGLPLMVGIELFQLVLGPMDALVKFGVNGAVRRMEYAADRFAVECPRPATEEEEEEKSTEVEADKNYGRLLGQALVKLHLQNLSTFHYDWLYSVYHHSHPHLAERLAALDACRAQRSVKDL